MATVFIHSILLQTVLYALLPVYSSEFNKRGVSCEWRQSAQGVTCSCRRGYRLASNRRTCIDVNECLDVNLNRCEHFCRNTDGGYRCWCRKGYVSPDGFTCHDVNECSGANKCEHTCENTIGSYKCSCRAGFVSPDGFRCEGCRVNSYRAISDVTCRECPANSHTQEGEKTSLEDCTCDAGFDGNPGLRMPCRDINECADGRNFGCSHTCINTPGSAHCACPSGYQLKENQKTCMDVDECLIKNGGCDGICHNTEGNFSCSCPQGYEASSLDRYSCDDVNECSFGNGGCSGDCVNYRGGFHCSCPEGHHLQADAKTCIPVSCPRVSVPPHSTLRCRDSAAGNKTIYRPGHMPGNKEFPVGAICRVKCDRGWGTPEAHPAIVCQKDGKWSTTLPDCQALRCPLLLPPSAGDVYPPSCKNGSATVGQKCWFTCPPGYRITGQEVLTCRRNLTWSKKKPTHCVTETEVSISCPDDTLTVELLPHEGFAQVQLPNPRSSLPVTVSPDWVSLERASVFPAGQTEVTFSVGNGNRTADCSVTVVVLDKHPPVFTNCPDDLVLTSGSVVTWDEPLPEDNVGVASLSRSLDPNSILSLGLHFVEYVARDFAGNIGQCIFRINVTTAGVCADLPDPENGVSNCREWLSGIICQPNCFENFTRTHELYVCDESGTWTPSHLISPCWPECLADETWSSQLKRCVENSSLP